MLPNTAVKDNRSSSKTPAWQRQGFDSPEEARQYRRSAYGTNTSRQRAQRPDVLVTNAPKKADIDVMSPLWEALDKEAGRESAHALDGHLQHDYADGDHLTISLNSIRYHVQIMAAFNVFGRLRYRIQFADGTAKGLCMALTQAQLRSITITATEGGLTRSYNESQQPYNAVQEAVAVMTAHDDILSLKRGSRRSQLRPTK